VIVGGVFNPNDAVTVPAMLIFFVSVAILLRMGALEETRQLAAYRARRQLEDQQAVFNSFWWRGILIDELHHDELYAEFKTIYDPGVPCTDATRYAMAKQCGREKLPNKVRDVLVSRSEGIYVWPDGSEDL
jgi:hypothetical protein